MKRIWLLSAMMVLLSPGVGYPQQVPDIGDIDAQQLVRDVETQYQGESSHSIMEMTIVTDAWTRQLAIEGWSEGRDKFLARILEPQKEAGTTTLRIGDEMWNYFPRIDRLVKIQSSLMGEGWMGSHFTNDDLVKETKIDQLYTFEVVSLEDSIVSIDCIPREDAAVVWDRVVYRINLLRTTPVESLYYNEDGELVRTMSFSDTRQISGRWVPMKMAVKPEDEPDERTVIEYTTLEFGVDIPENFFSIASLRRR